MRPPRTLDGPPCGPGGPTLDLTVMPTAPGKPPHRRAVVEAHVRNRLADPVWLLYDLGGGLPAVITGVILSRTSSAPHAYVWSFAGDGAFQAVHLPPGADLMLRELELSSFSGGEPLLLAFASTLDLGGRPATDWVGQTGILPERGDFTVTNLAPVFERQVDDAGAIPFDTRLLCVTRAEM